MTFLRIVISLAALVSLCAVIYPFRPFSSRGKAFLGLIGLSVLNVLLASGPPSTGSPSAATPTATPPSTSAGAGHDGTVPNREPESENWKYDSSVDEMTGLTSRFACTTSTNKLIFSFPYGGGSTGEMCFRRKGKALNAYIKISSGQFNCGIETCPLKLKFDDGPIQTFYGEESATHETGFLFIDGEQRLLSAVAKAKKLKLQSEYYQEGNQVLNFEVAGLDPKLF